MSSRLVPAGRVSRPPWRASDDDRPVGQHLPTFGAGSVGSQIDGSGMSAVRPKDGKQSQPLRKSSVTDRDGVAGPRFRPEKPPPEGASTPNPAKVARTLTLLSPGREMGATLVEHQQLVRATVRDHEPPVAELEGVVHLVQLKVLAGLDRADGEDGFRPDLPAEPRTLSRPAVLDDPDVGAVANLVLWLCLRAGLHGFRVGARLACDDGDKRDRCRATRSQPSPHGTLADTSATSPAQCTRFPPWLRAPARSPP